MFATRFFHGYEAAAAAARVLIQSLGGPGGEIGFAELTGNWYAVTGNWPSGQLQGVAFHDLPWEVRHPWPSRACDHGRNGCPDRAGRLAAGLPA